MPRFDGTGPNGQGSRTGGGRGYCNPSSATEQNLNQGCFSGIRKGLGRGCRGSGVGKRGMGGSRGNMMGRDMGFDRGFDMPASNQDQMNSIIARVEELEKNLNLKSNGV